MVKRVGLSLGKKCLQDTTTTRKQNNMLKEHHNNYQGENMLKGNNWL